MNWFFVIFYLALIAWTVHEDRRRLRVEASRRDAREAQLASLLRRARNGLAVATDLDERWRAQRDAVVAAIDEAIGRDR